MSAQPNKVLPDAVNTLESLWKLEKLILNSLDFHETLDEVVNSILTELGYLELGYKVVVLALLDKEEQVLKRVALSQTDAAKKTREVSDVPFEEIVIPLSATDNLCIKALLENKPQVTHYFPDILTPPVPVENALESQKNAGIKTSLVYPLTVREETIGIMIFSLSKEESEITAEERTLVEHFTDLAALAVENARLYSTLERESGQLAIANEKLLSLDKLKDEFLSIATHELRTPMTIIKSYVWMVTQGKAGSVTEKQVEYLNKASKGVERMLRLINDMLDVSRIEQGRVELKAEVVNLKDLISDFAEEFKVKTEEKNLQLIRIVPEDLPKVKADLIKTREVLTNFLGNSIKFTEHGSLTIKAQVDGEFIKVSIIDTGEGISAEDMTRLFQKFQRVDNSYVKQAETPGTGLGLYISKNYIEKMGGHVGVYSEGVGKGSTFWFTIPISTDNETHITSIAPTL